MTNGEARLRELVAAMEHRVKSSMSRPHRGRPAEIAGWQYYFDDSCDRCQLEQALAAPVQAEAVKDAHRGQTETRIGAGERANGEKRLHELADRWEKDSVRLDSEYACVWRLHAQELRMAMEPADVGAGEPRYVSQGQFAIQEVIIWCEGLDADVQADKLRIAQAELERALAARPDVAGGGLRRWANTGREGMMQEHPLGEFVLLADVRKMADDSPAPVTDEHPYYSKGTMQALHRAMAESEKGELLEDFCQEYRQWLATEFEGKFISSLALGKITDKLFTRANKLIEARAALAGPAHTPQDGQHDR